MMFYTIFFKLQINIKELFFDHYTHIKNTIIKLIITLIIDKIQ